MQRASCTNQSTVSLRPCSTPTFRWWACHGMHAGCDVQLGVQQPAALPCASLCPASGLTACVCVRSFLPCVQVSVHLPLERLAASFLAALLHLFQSGSCDPAGPIQAVLSRTLGNTPPLEARQMDGRAALSLDWEFCGLAAQRVIAWMSQVGV